MTDLERALLAVLIIVVCVGMFIGTYLLNKRTPKPEGCENIGSECEGCQITSCSHYQNKNEESNQTFRQAKAYRQNQSGQWKDKSYCTSKGLP